MIPKFRAWDKEKKKMFEPTYRAYAGELEDLLISLKGDLILRKIDKTIHESLFPDKFILMQYTGLKDKNGLEIYEGDIVHWMTEFISPMDMRTKHKIDSNKEVHQKESGEWGMGGMGNTLSKELFNVEVIGNIYENPELLKEQNK